MWIYTEREFSSLLNEQKVNYGFVSLLYGISTFVVDSMPKSPLQKTSSDII